MSALVWWLASGVLWGTALYAVVRGLEAAGLLGAPRVRAALWALVLAKFVVPVGPGLVSFAAPVALEAARAPVSAPATVSSWDLRPVERPRAEAGTAWLVPSAVAVWALGVLAVALVRVGRHRRKVRSVRALPEADQAVRDLVSKVAARVGQRSPEVRVGPGPLLFGLVAPVLVLPPGARGPRLEAMVAHELHHLRRRDAWVQAFQVTVESLFFFWPVVGWAGRRLALAREQACDEGVLEAGVLDAAGYAELLVDCARPPAMGLAMATTTQLEQRVESLLTGTRARRSWAAVGAVLALGLGLGTTGWAQEPAGRAARSLVAGVAHLEGPVDQAVLQTFLVTHQHEFSACLARFPEERGVLKLHWSFDAEGKVGDVCSSEGSTTSLDFSRCVSEVLQQWEFPRPTWGSAEPLVQVEAPFTVE